MFSVVKLVLLSRNESDNSIALTARAIRRSYFSRKMIPRLRQILGRELHFDSVARNDADEISAHLSRDMGEHLALPREIDAKHRARQHLRHRLFGHDRIFLRHEQKIMSGKKNSTSHPPQARRSAGAATRLE